MHTKRLGRLACAALLAGAVTGVTAAAASAATITAEGSTLVQPILAEWNSAWSSANPGNSVQYTGDGSTAGYTGVANGIDDFGGSDAPLSAYSAPTCAGCFQIPWALSATGVSFHINGLRRLHLTGGVIGQIYTGAITNWNDHRITSLNPGVHLPNLAIIPVHRSDGSGDTFAFSDFESKTSPAFSSAIGAGTKLSWPTGQGAPKNAGVASYIQGNNGAIGYVAVSYLIANGMPAAAIKNRAGKFEVPNLKNIANAAQSVHSVPSNNQLDITNPPRSARIAYPISTFTYAILPANQPHGLGALVKSFVTYAINGGQQFAFALDFAHLPAAVKRADMATLNQIH